MSELLSTSKLSKKYGSRFALKDADIHIKQGDIYGLIGRNGAGKTTLLKMINSQIVKTSGEIYTGGEAMKFGWPGIKIGALVEAPGLYPDCTAHDNLMYKCVSMGVYSKAYVDGLLARVELQNTGKKKVKQFSLGMKQRLSIALALVGKPKVAILDELTTGLDPHARRETWDLVERVRDDGVTIILVTHFMDEAERLCDRLVVIDQGRVVAQGTPAELTGASGEHRTFRMRLPEPFTAHATLTALPSVTTVTQVGEEIEVTGSRTVRPDVIIALHALGIVPDEVRTSARSLEDTFVALVAHEGQEVTS